MSKKNTVNITISVTPVERKELKQLALDNDTTVSALIRNWLKEHHEHKMKKHEEYDDGITPVTYTIEQNKRLNEFMFGGKGKKG